MKLIDLVNNIQSLSGDETIYAVQPWYSGSESLVAIEPEGGALPIEATAINAQYFLEVFIAKEFLEDWERSVTSQPTDEQKCERLIQYAINDA